MNTYFKFRSQILSMIVLFAGIFWIWLSSDTDPIPAGNTLMAPQVGLIAPDFTLSAIDGSEISLSDLSGSPVILNIWASWCPPCRAEMPDLQQAHLENSDTDLHIIGINSTSQDSLQNVLSFVEENKLTFPILLDTSGSVTRNFNIHSLPTTFFIDRSGKITRVLIGGPIPLALMRIEINKLLQE